MVQSLHHGTNEIDVLCKFPHSLLLNLHCIAHWIFSEKGSWNKKSAIRDNSCLSPMLQLHLISINSASIIRQGSNNDVGNETALAELYFLPWSDYERAETHMLEVDINTPSTLYPSEYQWLKKQCPLHCLVISRLVVASPISRRAQLASMTHLLLKI